MADLRKAAQTVLDRWDSSEHAASDLFEELRAALEQQAEPVQYEMRMRPTWEANSWSDWQKCSKESAGDYIKTPKLHDWLYEVRAIYTQPPQRKPLTDADIKRVMDGRGEEGDDDYIKPAFDPYGISEGDLIDFARAIEQAHGIKGEA